MMVVYASCEDLNGTKFSVCVCGGGGGGGRGKHLNVV